MIIKQYMNECIFWSNRLKHRAHIINKRAHLRSEFCDCQKQIYLLHVSIVGRCKFVAFNNVYNYILQRCCQFTTTRINFIFWFPFFLHSFLFYYCNYSSKLLSNICSLFMIRQFRLWSYNISYSYNFVSM